MVNILLIVVIVVVLLAVWMRIGLMIMIPWLKRKGMDNNIDVGTYILSLMWPMIVVMFMFLPWVAKPLIPKKYR